MRNILGAAAKSRAATARKGMKGRRGSSRARKSGGVKTMARRLTGR